MSWFMIGEGSQFLQARIEVAQLAVLSNPKTLCKGPEMGQMVKVAVWVVKSPLPGCLPACLVSRSCRREARSQVETIPNSSLGLLLVVYLPGWRSGCQQWMLQLLMSMP